MDSMLFGFKNINNLDLSSFDTKNVANMSWMFAYCNSLRN